MRTRLAILCLLLAAGTAAAATTYRWVDENGQVHYSDQPRPGAEEVTIRAPTTFTPPPTTAPVPAAGAPPGEQQTEAAGGYVSVRITNPGAGETLYNIGGQLSVGVAVDPPLRPGDQINLYLDGNRVADGPPGRLAFQLDEVYRGEHVVYAAVENASGREVLRSEPVTFYVQQASVQRPRPP